ncbi:uncharacterized protein EV420DRAFT_1643001 [Desarmillaria tabescens]|uniref:Uncharacterized protein n=1 Tax=Armillaria tabescens TaxID=1929756 RepID=A0AA39KCJ4_ARMTA|nr:uncharacterized protein EV420DRAFT_1643001 [Desarmillaria tabescens]KAK0458662.1 hypothetical protein EV420DRAFT_1643001 [Desarmillaria tabescens]
MGKHRRSLTPSTLARILHYMPQTPPNARRPGRKSRRPPPPSTPPPEASTVEESETVPPPIDPFTCAPSDTGTRKNTPFPRSLSRESTPYDQEPAPVVVKRESTPTPTRELSPEREDTQAEEPPARKSRESTLALPSSQETPELKVFEEKFFGV